MGKNDRLSRDQKRQAKLKKKTERSARHESMAYHGKKYRAAQYVPILHGTESGIYESYVMLDRDLTDDEVEASLERLILRLRQRALPILGEAEQSAEAGDNDDEKSMDMIHWNIRRHWQDLAGRGTLPGRDDLIGVLRTILHSLEIWRAQKLHARGYLHFLEGFMKDTGVMVRKLDPSEIENLEVIEDSPRALGREAIEDV